MTDVDGWNTTRRVLIPIMLLSQAFGFFFAMCHPRKWVRLVHRTVIMTFLFLAFIHEIPSIRFWLRASEGLHQALVTLETGSRWLLFFGNYALSTVYGERINAIIADLTKFDLPEVVRVKVFRLHVCHLFLNVSIIVAYDILGHDVVWTNSNHTSITSFIYIYNDIIIMWGAFQFFHVVNLVRESFREVNARLTKYSSDVKMKVIECRNAHLCLASICRRINSCFSIQILFIILFCTIQTTYALRAFISEVLSSGVSDSPVEIFHNFFWGSMYFSIVYQVIAIADNTTFESQKSSAIVHHVINEHYHKEDFVKELELFSMQILQHPAAFSIRLFQLKFTLLCTLISLLTTYIVMMITFQGEWKQGGLSGWSFKPVN